MKINKKIYQTIVDTNQTNVKEVKAEMQLAVDTAWDSNNAKFRTLFPNGKPTLEEFLITIKGEIS